MATKAILHGLRRIGGYLTPAEEVSVASDLGDDVEGALNNVNRRTVSGPEHRQVVLFRRTNGLVTVPTAVWNGSELEGNLNNFVATPPAGTETLWIVHNVFSRPEGGNWTGPAWTLTHHAGTGANAIHFSANGETGWGPNPSNTGFVAYRMAMGSGRWSPPIPFGVEPIPEWLLMGAVTIAGGEADITVDQIFNLEHYTDIEFTFRLFNSSGFVEVGRSSARMRVADVPVENFHTDVHQHGTYLRLQYFDSSGAFVSTDDRTPIGSGDIEGGCRAYFRRANDAIQNRECRRIYFGSKIGNTIRIEVRLR